MARLGSVLFAIVVFGCANNPTPPDGGRDGSVPSGPCGASGGACCVGRICELGLRCGAGDVCCIQAGAGGARCDSTAECCRGLSCEGGSCCAPQDSACTASNDCCLGLACSSGVCTPISDVGGPAGCGLASAVCCDGFTCSSGMICAGGTCQACGDVDQRCCDGESACVGSLACDVTVGTCVDPTDPSRLCGDFDQPCCPDPTGAPADCVGPDTMHPRGLVCVGGRCLDPEDRGFAGAPCGSHSGCDPGLICDRRTTSSGVCEMTPGDCGADMQMCCDLGGTEQVCSGSLHCQFGDCTTCRGPSLTCLLGGLLPGQQCCAGSVCRPAPLIPRCCMGQGGGCENSLDCCGLMTCGGDGTCQCGSDGSFCLDSSGCCEGLTCQTFFCRPAPTMCLESGTGCNTSSQCCAGLACSETRTEPTAPAVRQCCAGGSAACDMNEDCCGRMLCDNGECQCVEHAGLCDRDIECCNGEICIVGSCQDGTDCRREMQLCDESMAGQGCCGMLSCLRHYSADEDYCCVSRDFRCRQDADCCGDMTCDPATERCVGRTLGQSCDTQFDCIDGLSCVEPASGSGTCQDLT